ncbi:DUF4179 domain-containing protein, partial [Bacillus salitolerans]
IIKKLPILESVFYNKGDEGLKAVYNLGNAQVVDEEVHDNGITIRFTEVYYDDLRFSVAYEIKLPEKQEVTMDTLSFFMDANTYINGEKVQLSGGTGMSNEDLPYIRGVMDLDVLADKMGEEFDFTIEIFEVNNIKGKWKFNFPVSKVNGLSSPTKFISSDNLGNGMEVKNLVVTPSGVQTSVKFKESIKENKSSEELKYFITEGNGIWREASNQTTIHEARESYIEKFEEYYIKEDVLFPPISDKNGHFSILPAKQVESKIQQYPLRHGEVIKYNEYGSFEITKIQQSEGNLEVIIDIHQNSKFIPVNYIYITSKDYSFIYSMNDMQKIGNHQYQLMIPTNIESSDLLVEFTMLEPFLDLAVNGLVDN